MTMKVGTIRATLIVDIDGQVPRKVGITLPVIENRNGELESITVAHVLICKRCGTQLGSDKPGTISHGRNGSHQVEYSEG